MHHLWLGISVSAAVVWAKPVRFDMRDVGQRNVIHFVSDATVEKILGISNAISGWVEIDPQALSDGIKGEFEADVRTFHTGVELRNDHVREKFLSSTEFPIATFTLTKLLSASRSKLVDGQPVTLRVEGRLQLRGASVQQAILVKLIYLKESDQTRQRLGGNLVKVSVSFDVDTAAYHIEIPDNQKARYSRFVQVYVDAVGTDSPPAAIPAVEASRPKERRN